MLFDHIIYIYMILFRIYTECQIELKKQVGHDFRAQGYTIFEWHLNMLRVQKIDCDYFHFYNAYSYTHIYS